MQLGDKASSGAVSRDALIGQDRRKRRTGGESCQPISGLWVYLVCDRQTSRANLTPGL
ncbi:hypothetical protein [Tolypothrix sp. VBCCA 56010]|uniref:hypothetical protein n=1 Tax=Tolypothrix sp. VBCCA 56010 TaxID=3137731 RepID=UPI003D7EAC44